MPVRRYSASPPTSTNPRPQVPPQRRCAEHAPTARPTGPSPAAGREQRPQHLPADALPLTLRVNGDVDQGDRARFRGAAVSSSRSSSNRPTTSPSTWMPEVPAARVLRAVLPFARDDLHLDQLLQLLGPHAGVGPVVGQQGPVDVVADARVVGRQRPRRRTRLDRRAGPARSSASDHPIEHLLVRRGGSGLLSGARWQPFPVGYGRRCRHPTAHCRRAPVLRSGVRRRAATGHRSAPRRP